MIDEVAGDRHTVGEVLHLMRRPGRDTEQLAGPQQDGVAREEGEVRAGSEDWVETVVELGTESTSSLGRVESPLLLSGDEIHPEVGPESVNVKTTVRTGLSIIIIIKYILNWR